MPCPHPRYTDARIPYQTDPKLEIRINQVCTLLGQHILRNWALLDRAAIRYGRMLVHLVLVVIQRSVRDRAHLTRLRWRQLGMAWWKL